MNDNIRMMLLYDIYGNLLTKKQSEIFEEYYLYNLSLREIANNREISYQAVADSIKKSENMLNNFENNVKMLELSKRVESVYILIEKTKDLNNIRQEILNKLNLDVGEDDI